MRTYSAVRYVCIIQIKEDNFFMVEVKKMYFHAHSIGKNPKTISAVTIFIKKY